MSTMPANTYAAVTLGELGEARIAQLKSKDGPKRTHAESSRVALAMAKFHCEAAITRNARVQADFEDRYAGADIATENALSALTAALESLRGIPADHDPDLERKTRAKVSHVEGIGTVKAGAIVTLTAKGLAVVSAMAEALDHDLSKSPEVMVTRVEGDRVSFSADGFPCTFPKGKAQELVASVANPAE